jgi:TolB protein
VGETAGRTQIYAYRDSTEDPDRMTVSNASDADPALAKNGRDVAFASNRDGDWNIYVFMDTHSPRMYDGPTTVLTHDPGDDRRPAWSPNGKQIAFDSDRNGTREIYVMKADGSDVRQLTHDAGGALAPSWSPDGETIAFYTQDGVESDLFTIKADGTDESRLTTGFRNEDPSWSRDGDLIAFASNRDGDFDIYTISIVDRAVTRIVARTGSNETEPSWCGFRRDSSICFTSDDVLHGAYAPDTYTLLPDGQPTMVLAGRDLSFRLD